MKKDICGPLRSPLCVMKTDIWSLLPPNREQECAKAISIAHCLHSVKWSGDQFRYSRLEFGYPYLIPVTCEQILWRIHNPANVVKLRATDTWEYAPRFGDAKCVNIFWTDPWQGPCDVGSVGCEALEASGEWSLTMEIHPFPHRGKAMAGWFIERIPSFEMDDD